MAKYISTPGTIGWIFTQLYILILKQQTSSSWSKAEGEPIVKHLGALAAFRYPKVK
jgi:hypothetical protein